MSTITTAGRVRNFLGSIKYRTKNLLKEQRVGPDPHFPHDLRVIGPMVRTAFYNPMPVGFRTRVMLTERVVEYPSVFRLLPSVPTTIVDIGSGDSPLPYQMASLGHTVHAVDVLPYPLSHPRLHTYQQDAMQLPFRSGSIPWVTAISCLEHFGLGGYGDPELPDAPFLARDEIVRVLARGGKLIASFPVGKGSVGGQSKRHNYVVFTRELLERFTRGLRKDSMMFFRRTDTHWGPCVPEEAFEQDSYTHGAAAIVVLLLSKGAGLKRRGK